MIRRTSQDATAFKLRRPGTQASTCSRDQESRRDQADKPCPGLSSGSNSREAVCLTRFRPCSALIAHRRAFVNLSSRGRPRPVIGCGMRKLCQGQQAHPRTRGACSYGNCWSGWWTRLRLPSHVATLDEQACKVTSPWVDETGSLLEWPASGGAWTWRLLRADLATSHSTHSLSSGGLSLLAGVSSCHGSDHRSCPAGCGQASWHAGVNGRASSGPC